MSQWKHIILVAMCGCGLGCTSEQLSQFVPHQFFGKATPATASPAQPPSEISSDTARIYVIRNDAEMVPLDYSILLDKNLMGKLEANASYLSTTVEPGTHVVRCEPSVGSSFYGKQVELTAEGGQDYYLEAHLRYINFFDTGDLTFRLLKPETGRDLVKRFSGREQPGPKAASSGDTIRKISE